MREKKRTEQIAMVVTPEEKAELKAEAVRCGVSLTKLFVERCRGPWGGKIERREERVVANSLMAIYGGVDNGPVRQVNSESAGTTAESEGEHRRVDAIVPGDGDQTLDGRGFPLQAHGRDGCGKALNPLLAVYGVRDGGVRAVDRGAEVFSAYGNKGAVPDVVFVRDSHQGGAGGPLVDYRVLDLDGEAVKCCLKCYRVNGEPGGQCKTCRGLNEP